MRGVNFSEDSEPASDCNSRIGYHCEVLHLLAECVHENEPLRGQLREILPLSLFIGNHSMFSETSDVENFKRIPPGMLSRQNIDLLVYRAYSHLFQSLYIEPLTMGYSMIEDLFFRPLTVNRDGHVIAEAPIDMFADALSNALDLLSSADLTVDSPLVYSAVMYSGGAAHKTSCWHSGGRQDMRDFSPAPCYAAAIDAAGKQSIS